MHLSGVLFRGDIDSLAKDLDFNNFLRVFTLRNLYVTLFQHSGVAQLVERPAVNGLVVGSSPTTGALVTKPHILWGFVLYGLIF